VAHASFGGASLSPELEADAARRLGALALVVAGVTATLGLVEPLTGVPSVLGVRLRIGLAVLAVALSLALYAGIATGRVSARRALGLGLAYEIGQGFLAGLAFHSTALAAGAEVRGWTPVAVWTLAYPLIVPTTTRRVVVASLATAAMDPLGIWLNVLAGGPRPTPSALGHMLAPTLVVCLIAPVAAGIVYGLTVEVKRAREMGSYRLVEKLGQGGMGEVWRAEHRMLARGAAIKLIRPGSLGAEGGHARELLRRFEREAQATAALRSPHTIELYDYGVAADGTFHYVMELLEGLSLQSLVARFGALPPERAVHLLRQICHSLAEAHAAGLVHRDIKPANVFVCRLGLDVDFVKVLDFGLVKVRGPQEPGAEAITVEGTFAGTPAFMPPEVALAAEPIDGRADLYALGCVAYWLLTGQRVFEGANPMQLVVDHVRTAPVPPSQRTAQAIPEGLERLVLACLEKDPARRPASAVELSRKLEALALEPSWTEARARQWWVEHGPGVASEPGSEGPGSSRESTRSIAGPASFSSIR
jgi:serine/threonine-protein kinase